AAEPKTMCRGPSRLLPTRRHARLRDTADRGPGASVLLRQLHAFLSFKFFAEDKAPAGSNLLPGPRGNVRRCLSGARLAGRWRGGRPGGGPPSAPRIACSWVHTSATSTAPFGRYCLVRQFGAGAAAGAAATGTVAAAATAAPPTAP